MAQNPGKFSAPSKGICWSPGKFVAAGVTSGWLWELPNGAYISSLRILRMIYTHWQYLRPVSSAGMPMHLLYGGYIGMTEYKPLQNPDNRSWLPLLGQIFKANLQIYLLLLRNYVRHAVLYLPVQLYQQFAGRQFHTITNTMTTLQVKHFTLLPSASFLVALDEAAVKVMQTDNVMISFPEKWVIRAARPWWHDTKPCRCYQWSRKTEGKESEC